MLKVRIAECVDGDGVVRGHAFEDAEVVGPAILVPLGTGNRLEDCAFPYSPDQFGLMRIGGGPVVMLADCAFRRCTFALDVDTLQLQGIVDA